MTTEFSAARMSRWFARLLAAHPNWHSGIAALASAALSPAVLGAYCETLRAGASYRDENHLKEVLRSLRNQVLAATMERDLTGRADLAEVMSATSALAEIAIGEALRFLSHDLSRSLGVPRSQRTANAQDLVVVGMGKLGGAELNVSSDVDLVFVYGEDGFTDKAGANPTSNQEFFTRLARRLIGVLAQVTADGFVFRVDMRLRPNGDSGPLVASLAMLEEYFVAQGRNWERYAWIKARVVSPAVLAEAGHHERVLAGLAGIIEPFVYRRYLDFGAIQALRALHEQIRSEVNRRTAKHVHKAINVKLGRGGIREIEFLAQHFQLIRGGRDRALRSRSTLATLDVLMAQGLLQSEVGERLQSDYVLLRNVEHRLQYLDDAQTHSLPVEAEDRDRLSLMCAPWGGASFAELLGLIEREQRFVAQEFDLVFGTRPQASQPLAQRFALWSESLAAGEPNPALVDALGELGYEEPGEALLRLKALWTSPKAKALSEQNRERLQKLVPVTVTLATERASSECPAGKLLGRLLDLLEAIASRGAYLAFLGEFPAAFDRVAALLSASPWAARYLTLHPLLLDELLDPPGDSRVRWDAVRARLEDALARAHGDVERQMDLLRETHHAELFGLLIKDLEQRLTVEELADELSALADLIVAAALGTCWTLVRSAPDEPCRFAIIAYGKLGGKELGYASDLDLVFLYEGSGTNDDDAVRYARLAQRLMSWLTSRTTAGSLFEVDLRLRPEGTAGLMVTTLDGFVDYQRRAAWVWEHQALTRARFCAGDDVLGAAFEKTRRSILSEARDTALLRREIVAMRERMHLGHPNTSDRFDLKHDEGGMVDIEFCVQYLVLAYSSRFAELLDDVGNIALLGRSAQCGLIDAALAQTVAHAYRQYRRRQHRLRLAEARFARVSPEEFAGERQAVGRLCESLELNWMRSGQGPVVA
ncbi:MAG: bifunctional [glutamate--ammonia ligase]-adenylyl-L-tyrosine phosphorylase/[glutamate--ammonia-ligase] adenylyltransferase [Burkholderiaceae bacterium]